MDDILDWCYDFWSDICSSSGSGYRDGISKTGKVSIITGIVVCLICCVIIIIVLILVLVSINKIEYDEYGLLYDTAVGTVDTEKVYTPGAYWLPLWQKFIKYPKFWKTVSFGADLFPEEAISGSWSNLKTRTRDGVAVEMDLGMQYQLIPEKLIQLHLEFGPEYEIVYEQEARAAVYDAVGDYDAIQLLTNRTEFVNATIQELSKRFENVYAKVRGVQIGNIELSKNINTAIADKLSQQQEGIRVSIERDATLIYADIDLYNAQINGKITELYAQSNATVYTLRTSTDANLTRESASKDQEALLDIKDRLNIEGKDIVTYMWYNLLLNFEQAKLIVNLGKDQDIDALYVNNKN